MRRVLVRPAVLLLAVAAFLAPAAVAQSTTWTGTTSSAWNVASNWSSGVPTSAVNAVISPAANNPSTSGVAGAACLSLTVLSGGSLNVAAGFPLSVSGGANVTNGGVVSGGTVRFVGSGTVTTVGTGSLASVEVASASTVTLSNSLITGSLTLTSGTLSLSSSSTAQVQGAAALNGGTLSGSGTLDVGGNVSFAGASSNVGGIIRCAGNWSSNAAFAPTSGTVVLDGAGAQSLSHSGGLFYALTIQSGSSTSTSSSLHVQDQLTIAGSFATTAALDVDSSVTVSSGGSLNTGATSPTLGSSFTCDGSLTATGTYVFDGSGVTAVQCSPAVLPNVQITGAGVFQLLGPTVSGNLSQSSGLLDGSTVTVGGNAQFLGGLLSGGTLDVGGDVTFAGTSCSAAGTILCGGDWSSDGSFAPTTGTVVFSGAGAQSLTHTGGQFAALNVDPGSATTTASALHVLGNLTLDGSFTTSGALDVDGALVVGAATLQLDGATAHVLGSAQLTGSTLTSTGTLDVDGAMTLSGASATSPGTVLCAGNWSSDAAFAPTSGSVTLDGGAPQTLAHSGGQFHDLTIAAGSAVSTASALHVLNDLSVLGSLTTTSTLDVDGLAFVDAAGTLSAGSATHLFSGSLTCNGTLTASGVFRFNGTGATVVQAPATVTLPSVELTGSATYAFTGGTVRMSSLLQTAGTITGSNVRVLGAGQFLGGVLDASTTDVDGNVTFAGTSATTPGTVRCGGAWVSDAGFAPTAGTLVFDGGPGQTFSHAGGQVFGLFVLASSSTSSASNLHALGPVNVFGTLSLTGALDADGAVTVQTGATLDAGSGAHHVAGNMTVNGSLTASGSFTFDGAGASSLVTAPAVQLPSVEVACGGAFTTPGGTVTVAGTLTLSSGTLSAPDMHVLGDAQLLGGDLTGGTLDVDGNVTFAGTTSTTPGTIRCGGDWSSSVAFAPTQGLVELDRAGAQSLSSSSGLFYDLTVTGGSATTTASNLHVQGQLSVGTGSLTTTGTLDVDGTTTVAAAGTLGAGSATHTFGDDFVCDGSLSASGIFRFDGAGASTIQAGAAVTLPSLQIIGSGSFDLQGSPLEIGGSLTVTSGSVSGTSAHVSGAAQFAGGSLQALDLDVDGDVTFAGCSSTTPGTIQCGGNWTSDAAFAPTADTVVLDRTGAQTLSHAGAFFDLRVAAGSVTTTSGALDVDSQLVLDGALTASSAVDVGAVLALNAGGELHIGAAAFHVVGAAQLAGGILDNAGLLDVDGDVTFSGTAGTTPGTIHCGGAWTSDALFAPTTGAVRLDAAGAQALSVAGQFFVLTVASGSTTTAASGVHVADDLTVDGTLIVASGMLDVDGDLSVTGALDGGAGLHRLGGDFDCFGSLTATGTLELDGSGVSVVQVGPAVVLPSVSITGSGTFQMFAASIAIDGTLAQTAGLFMPASTTTVAGAGDFQGGTLSGIGSTLDVEGDVTFSGTSCTSPPTIRCAGSWHADAGFAPSSGTVELDGVSGTTMTSLGGVLNFNQLVLKNGPRLSGGDFTLVASSVTVQPGASLTISGHTIVRPSGSLTVDGTLSILVEGELSLASSASVVISSGGRLDMISSNAALPARVTGASGGGYSFVVHGQLFARNYVFEGMGSSGIVISQSAQLGSAPDDLRGGTFDKASAVPNSVLLDIQRPLATTLAYLSFLRSNATGTYGVRCLAGAPIEITAYDGPLSGPSFEHDPGSRVSWVASGSTTLSSFSASGRAGYALVSWATSAEVNIDRFLLERGPSALGPFSLVAEVVPGASPYSLFDSPLPPGSTQFWRLSERLTHGQLRMLGTTSAAIANSGVVYVRSTATGLNSGSSWTDAFTDLTDALTIAPSGSQVWVAAATYRPAPPTGPRTLSFELRDGIAVYGGFAGTETALGQRNPALNVTVLSGDLAADDLPGFVNNGENAFHVVRADGVGATAILDGFTISGGNANGGGGEDRGGGLTSTGGAPTIVGCQFRANRASADGGGALCATASAATFRTCVFRDNLAASGGALSSDQASPLAVSCTFLENDATLGGAVHGAGGGGGLVNCSFYSNAATQRGGALYHSLAGGPVVTNGRFTGNSAIRGGAVALESGSGLQLRNSSLAGNSATTSGGGVLIDGAPPVLVNCVAWSNSDPSGNTEQAQIHVLSGTPSVNHCCVQGLTGALGGTGNVGADPLLGDVNGVDGVIGNADDDLRLRPLSAAADAGNNSAVPADVGDLDGDANVAEQTPLDLGSNARFADDPAIVDTGSGTAPLVDMGALEREFDCNGNSISDATDISSATSQDCNGNGIPDECDIADGYSPDVDLNGIPDTCSTGTFFCAGDGSGTPCPCGNNSPSGQNRGCLSSLGVGARMIGGGNVQVSNDTFVLLGSDMPNSSALYFQGTTQQNGGLGAAFGDGLRCAAGAIIRLGTKINAAGQSQYPAAGDQSISVRGLVPAAGGVRTYQIWYRNAAAFCTASTFNLSNGLEVTWVP